MPLLDHFHPPLHPDSPWEGFHSAWPTLITQYLNHGGLPPGYVAVPHTKLGSLVEVDTATFERGGFAGTADGGVVTAVYAPPRPRITRPVIFYEPDLFEVQVRRREAGPRLVAAVELVSPANKDRASHRQAFVAKCASYLRQGVSVIAVDVVTARSGNLHADLLEFLGAGPDPNLQSPDQLYAVAYRALQQQEQTELEAWPEGLALGAELPVLPLWLAPDLAVPLNLEKTYTATCDLLLIR
jgi:hypothetical protein